MTNTIIQTIATFFGGFLNELLVVPAKALWAIAREYILNTNMEPVSIIGMFIWFVAFSFACKWMFIGIRAFIGHMIFLRKEKKRKEIMAIRKHERARTERNLAANRQFDDLYAKYVGSDELA